MTIDEHLKHNIEILKALDRVEAIGGPFTWMHEICVLEGGLYRAKGLLELPFAVEKFDDGQHLYTYFDKSFIIGEGVVDPESPGFGKCMDQMSWDNHLRAKGRRVYELHVFNIELADMLGGVSTLIAKYFELRKELKSASLPKDETLRMSHGLAMRCFMEYQRSQKMNVSDIDMFWL